MDSKYNVVGSGGSDGLIKKPNFKIKRPALPCSKQSKKSKVLLVNGKNGDKTLSATKNTSVDTHHKCKDILASRKKLPVYSVRDRLLEEIKKNETMIIIGETGSGKTTQIPQIIHEARLEGLGMIGVTQPRRVAAITIAMRVATEMSTNIGAIVGYTVRFEDVSSNKTKVKYLTDGMLLREAMGDPMLKRYSIIILDEAHERTVNTDVLFGVVKLAQKDRIEKKIQPLKVIVMSATMDVDTFSDYFNKCPVIYLEGRTFPVTVYHSKNKLDDYQHAALCTIFQLHSSAPPSHDFLVFLTGQEEIETLSYNIKQIAKEAEGAPVKVCPLYAGLPAAKQLDVWKEAPVGTRKIVLATNIAEASVTIPRIKYVIDSGMVKERLWCASSGVERLRVSACSRAACWQRTGRAGRDSPGRAYRLYTAADFARRPHHHTPDILRCPLASTLLWMVSIGIEPSTFPLMDKPPDESVRASMLLLHDLGAVDSVENPQLTLLGKKMSAFPIDPKYSKVLLSANDFDCLEEALSIVSVLSSESVYHSPLQRREEAYRARHKFASPLGDHVTLLNVYKAFCDAPLKKQWCKENYLHHRNLEYAAEVRRQLATICQRLNMPLTSCGQEYEQVLKCLLTGMFSQTAWLRGAAALAGGSSGGGGGGGGRYVSAGGVACAVHPSSVLHAARPPHPALLYTELVSTQRAYLATVSAVLPLWLHQLVPDFARRCRAPH